MAEPITIQCKLEIAAMKGALGAVSGDKLSVGHEFAVHCEGEIPAFNKEKLQLQAGEQDKYKIKLLTFQQESNNKISLLVTSYLPGDHQLKGAKLLDDQHAVILSDLNFKVESVIHPQDPPSDPFGPVGPLKLSLSVFFWLGLVLTIAAAGLLVWTVLRRKMQRQKLLEEMAVHDSALTPVAEISKSIRQFQRDLKVEKVKDINRAFRVYLARKFQIPTLAWSDRVILKDFKKRFPKLYRNHGSLLTKALFEINQALHHMDRVKEKDLEQYIELIRRCVDSLEKGEKT